MLNVRISSCKFPKPHALLRRVRFHELHRGLNQRYEVGRLKFILFAALFDAREIEDVFDKRRQPPAFLHDKTEILFLFLRLRDFFALQVFRHQPHRRDGRAQFVRDAGNEIGFHFIELKLLAEHPPGGQQPDQGGGGKTATSEPNQNVRAPCRW